jgi:hypothetical protein
LLWLPNLLMLTSDVPCRSDIHFKSCLYWSRCITIPFLFRDCVLVLSTVHLQIAQQSMLECRHPRSLQTKPFSTMPPSPYLNLRDILD